MNEFQTIREALGLSQEQAGKILGVSQSMVSRLEAGQGGRHTDLYLLKLREFAKGRRRRRAA